MLRIKLLSQTKKIKTISKILLWATLYSQNSKEYNPDVQPYFSFRNKLYNTGGQDIIKRTIRSRLSYRGYLKTLNEDIVYEVFLNYLEEQKDFDPNFDKNRDDSGEDYHIAKYVMKFLDYFLSGDTLRQLAKEHGYVSLEDQAFGDADDKRTVAETLVLPQSEIDLPVITFEDDIRALCCALRLYSEIVGMNAIQFFRELDDKSYLVYDLIPLLEEKKVDTSGLRYKAQYSKPLKEHLKKVQKVVLDSVLKTNFIQEAFSRLTALLNSLEITFKEVNENFFYKDVMGLTSNAQVKEFLCAKDYRLAGLVTTSNFDKKVTDRTLIFYNFLNNYAYVSFEDMYTYMNLKIEDTQDLNKFIREIEIRRIKHEARVQELNSRKLKFERALARLNSIIVMDELPSGEKIVSDSKIRLLEIETLWRRQREIILNELKTIEATDLPSTIHASKYRSKNEEAVIKNLWWLKPHLEDLLQRKLIRLRYEHDFEADAIINQTIENIVDKFRNMADVKKEFTVSYTSDGFLMINGQIIRTQLSIYGTNTSYYINKKGYYVAEALQNVVSMVDNKAFICNLKKEELSYSDMGVNSRMQN